MITNLIWGLKYLKHNSFFTFIGIFKYMKSLTIEIET